MSDEANDGVNPHYLDHVVAAGQTVMKLARPDEKEVITGVAEVRQLFKVPKFGTVAGCMILEGVIDRKSPVRVVRDIFSEHFERAIVDEALAKADRPEIRRLQGDMVAAPHEWEPATVVADDQLRLRVEQAQRRGVQVIQVQVGDQDGVHRAEIRDRHPSAQVGQARANGELYPQWLHHGIRTFGSADVLRYLGYRTPNLFRGEVTSTLKRRPEGVRLTAADRAAIDAELETLPDWSGVWELVGGTLFDHVTPGMSIYKEEIFGPVVTLTPFDTEEEVLMMANSTQYGLSATIWTSDLKRAHRTADKVQAGIVWINSWLVRDLRTPFGGVNASGVGREGGWEALRFFTEAKNVYVPYNIV